MTDVDFRQGEWVLYPMPEFDLILHPGLLSGPLWICTCGATMAGDEVDANEVYHFLPYGHRWEVTGPSEVSAREVWHWVCPPCWDELPD